MATCFDWPVKLSDEINHIGYTQVDERSPTQYTQVTPRYSSIDSSKVISDVTVAIFEL